MATIKPLIPRQQVPGLEVALVGGGSWNLAEQRPDHFTLIVFYRGRHCPVCAKYLRDLHDKLEEFDARGVHVIAVSTDTQERAEQARADWRLDTLEIGYGLELDAARQWGLYISSSRGKTSIGIEEPPLFAEPAIYLVRPDGTLYSGSVQTMPFARPHFADILATIDHVLAKDYPARGEVLDHREAAAKQG